MIGNLVKRQRESSLIIPAEATRNPAIDILKALSIFGVLVIHTSSDAIYAFPIGSFHWYSTVFWEVLIRFCVPTFFMCSGALMLDPAKEISLKKLYTKYLPRLVIALLFWALAYGAVDFLLAAQKAGHYDSALLVKSVKDFVRFKHHFHLYFLHIIILNYAVLPITRLIAKHASRVELRYVLGLWFLLGILFPIARKYYPLSRLVGIPQQYAINFAYAAIGFGLAGYYLKTYPPKKPSRFALIFLAGFAATAGPSLYECLQTGKLELNWWEGIAPGAVLMAMGLFGFILAKAKGKTCPRWVLTLSKASCFVRLDSPRPPLRRLSPCPRSRFWCWPFRLASGSGSPAYRV